MIWKASVAICIVFCVLCDSRGIAVSEKKVELNFNSHNGDLSHSDHLKPEHHEGYAWTYPSYEYSYKVEDPHTHDKKAQHEVRKGEEVTGDYWLIQPDGEKRYIKYHVDDKSGFTAVINYTSPYSKVYYNVRKHREEAGKNDEKKDGDARQKLNINPGKNQVKKSNEKRGDKNVEDKSHIDQRSQQEGRNKKDNRNGLDERPSDNGRDDKRDGRRDGGLHERDGRRDSSARGGKRDGAQDGARDDARDSAKDGGRDSRRDGKLDNARGGTPDSGHSRRNGGPDGKRDGRRDGKPDSARDGRRDGGQDGRRDGGRDGGQDGVKSDGSDSALSDARDGGHDGRRDGKRDGDRDDDREDRRDGGRDGRIDDGRDDKRDGRRDGKSNGGQIGKSGGEQNDKQSKQRGQDERKKGTQVSDQRRGEQAKIPEQHNMYASLQEWSTRIIHDRYENHEKPVWEWNENDKQWPRVHSWRPEIKDGNERRESDKKRREDQRGETKNHGIRDRQSIVMFTPIPYKQHH